MKKFWFKPLAFIVLLALVFILLRAWGVPEKIKEVAAQGQGGANIFVFALMYAGALILLLPVSPLAVFAGEAYGPAAGAAACWAGAITGSVLSFFIARFFLRDTVERIVFKKKVLTAADYNIGKNGVIYVILMRIIPFFPASFVGYFFGMTKVKPAVYILWSAVFLLPSIIYYTTGSGEFNKTPLNNILIPVIIITAIVVLIIIGRRYTRYL